MPGSAVILSLFQTRFKLINFNNTGVNKLSKALFQFCIVGIMLNSCSLLFQKYLKQFKTLTQAKLDNNVLGNIKQSFNLKMQIVFRCALNFPRVSIILL